MRLFAALFLAVCSSVSAAVIQGIVLDEESGNPLARTVVNLIPLPGTPAGVVSLRAGDRGAFAVTDVRPGWYILRCTRKGFVPAEVGQLRPGRPGMPFEVTPDAQSSFFQVRMRRLGAVTGSVLDQNNVGIPEWPVHIYSAQKPIRRIAETKTDDRGNYRIGELEAGSYFVRSAPGALEDDTRLLPTFYKFGAAVENADPVRVRVGETQPDLVLRPVTGRMVEVGGSLTSQTPATLTLVTDTGRRVLASASGNPVPFSASVVPGLVELIAEGPRCGGYVRISAGRDMQGIRVACGPLDPPIVNWIPDNVRGYFDGRRLSLLMRRVDLDGTGPERSLKPREGIPPGHWEFHAQVGADYYVKSISTQFSPRAESGAESDGWFGLDIGTSATIYVALSSKPASLSGVVTADGKPVVGAAVYLERFDPELPNPRVQLTDVRSDAQGNYKFSGLTPGRYRVLSSFDFDPEDRFAMERAPVLTLHEGENATQALGLIVP
jgi:hypothetical protein